MIKEDVLIGGEESGGISIRGHIPEGDGVLMALMILEVMGRDGTLAASALQGPTNLYSG